ncbi:hypothetical protein [Candidatus Electronema sp. PJ]|uniref:hypothetical protein n=1 Tax=Candidatus Electronema sp. PJ TaxID=3401572 RepID=UPI003AA9686A
MLFFQSLLPYISRLLKQLENAVRQHDHILLISSILSPILKISRRKFSCALWILSCGPTIFPCKTTIPFFQHLRLKINSLQL